MTLPAGPPRRGAAALAVVAGWWWLFVVRGVASVAFGVAALLWPEITALVLVALFAAWSMIDGVSSVVGALRRGERGGDQLLLAVDGLLGILVGVVVLAWPEPTLVVIARLAGAWAVVSGILELLAARRLRRAIGGEWLMASAGIASILAGVVLIVAPLAGIIGLIVVLAAYAVAFGLLLVGLGLRLRRADRASA